MAAKVKKQTQASVFIKKPRIKRPGVHAKTKQSKNKRSQNYKKPYVSQG